VYLKSQEFIETVAYPGGNPRRRMVARSMSVPHGIAAGAKHERCIAFVRCCSWQAVNIVSGENEIIIGAGNSKFRRMVLGGHHMMCLGKRSMDRRWFVCGDGSRRVGREIPEWH
jgi:hypothetical protein